MNPHHIFTTWRGAAALACLLIATPGIVAGAAIQLPASQELLAIHRGSFNAQLASLLFRIDPVGGTATFIGDIGFASLQSLAASPQGVLYSWDVVDGLVTINPTTGQGTDVNPNAGSGFAPDMQSLDFAPNGDLIGVTDVGNRNELYRINTTTGLATFIASSPLPVAIETTRGIAFLGNRLVGVSWNFQTPSSRYFEIDPNTAAISLIGVTGQPHLNSLARDANGRLYTVSTDAPPTLAVLDPQTGATLESQPISTPEIAPDTLDVRGLTVRTILEPSSLALAFGSVACLWLQRTRE